MKSINIESKNGNYRIVIESGLLNHVQDFLDVDKTYIIITDDMIPTLYINQLISSLNKYMIIKFPAGEQSKSLKEYQKIISIMQENNVSRDACIIALGGGVTGDLSGFIASTYMRGIDYIQIPTSLLAQIDSSVGGKVAINTELAKNSIGQFYSPSLVLIDPITLQTLDERQFNNGMAEMIKYGMIHSLNLFEEIETQNIKDNLEHFIYESLSIKRYYVENDEFDHSIRQILNFGHTFGHAYESLYRYEKYLHGEAVALGMLKVCNNYDVRRRLIAVLKKYNLPIEDSASDLDLIPYIKNDKKNTSNYLNLIIVDKIGKAMIVKKENRK